MGIEQIREAVIASPETAAVIFTKQDIYGVIENMAQTSRQPCESIYQARARIQKSALGQQIMKVYSAAQQAKPVQKAAPIPVEKARAALPGGDVIGEVDKLAAKIARDEKMPISRARDEAWSRNGGELKARYDKDRAHNLRSISGGRC